MKNLLQHPSPEIRSAMVRLCDALTQYERSTGREYLVLVKVDSPDGVHEYRSVCGGPANPMDSDADLLESFANLTA